jgi:hypothetical protein
MGQVGEVFVQSWAGWPNLQQFRHSVIREAENIFSHLWGWENKRMVSLRSVAWSGGIEITTQVVDFVLSARSSLRKQAALIVAPVAKPFASLMVLRWSAGAVGRTWTGRF